MRWECPSEEKSDAEEAKPLLLWPAGVLRDGQEFLRRGKDNHKLATSLVQVNADKSDQVCVTPECPVWEEYDAVLGVMVDDEV